MEHLSLDRYIIVSRYGDCVISYVLTRDCRLETAYSCNLASLIAENNFSHREATELLSQAKGCPFTVWTSHELVPTERTFEELDLQIIPVEISASFFQ